AANPQTLASIAKFHTRAQQAIAHLRTHSQPGPDGNYDDIVSSGAAFNRMMPRIISAASVPRESRPTGLVTARIGARGNIRGALPRKSDSLSRSIPSSGPLINEMLRVADISWRRRSAAGIDRHAIMSAILADGPPSDGVLQSFAEMKGRVDPSWRV